MGCCTSAQKEEEPKEADKAAEAPPIPVTQDIVETVEAEAVPAEIIEDVANKAHHGTVDPKIPLGSSMKKRSDGTDEWTTYISVPDDAHTIVQILSLNGVSGKIDANKFNELCEANGYDNTIGRFEEYFPISRVKADKSALITPNRLLNSIVNSKFVKLQISDVFDDCGLDRRIIKLTGGREKDIYSALDLYISALSKESQKLVKTSGYFHKSLEDRCFTDHSSSKADKKTYKFDENHVDNQAYKKPGFTSDDRNEYVLFFPRDGNFNSQGDYLYSSKLKVASALPKTQTEHKGIIDYKGRTFNVVSIVGDDENAILIGRANFDNDKHHRLKNCIFDYQYCEDRNAALSSHKSLRNQSSDNNNIDSNSLASVLLDELFNESCVQRYFGWPLGGATLKCENCVKWDIHLLDLPYSASKIDATMRRCLCSAKLISKYRKNGEIVNVMRIWGQQENLNALLKELTDFVSLVDNQPVRTTVLGC